MARSKLRWIMESRKQWSISVSNKGQIELTILDKKKMPQEKQTFKIMTSSAWQYCAILMF